MDPAGQPSSPPESPPSSPLSVLSKSPSLPPSPLVSHDVSREYPSPLPSTPSGSEAPAPVAGTLTQESATVSSQNNTDNETMRRRREPTTDGARDGLPPAKRRRITGPKTRTTQHLDLTRLNASDRFQLDRLLNALRRKKKIVVIAGAGISTSSGLDDFRSKTGLFASVGKEHKVKGGSGKHLFDASVYRHDEDTKKFHDMVGKMVRKCATAQPTPFHHMLASLAKEGRLMRLYTQNIDCIDTRMPPLATNVPLNLKGPWPVTIQVHGSLDKMLCSKCGNIEPFDTDLFDSHEAPPCRKCTEQDMVRTEFAGKRSHGIGRLRPRIVLYNEYNPDEEAIGNVSKADLRGRPDAVIVVGTTLQIPGVRRLVKELCQVTRDRRDGFTAWINLDPEPRGIEFKDCWDLVVKGQCDEVADLLGLRPWYEEEGDLGSTLSEEDEKIREELLSRKIEVLLEARVVQSESEEDVQPELPDVEASPQSAEIEVALETKAKKRPTTETATVVAIPTPGASPMLPGTLTSAGGKLSVKMKQSRLSFGKSRAAKKDTVSATTPEGKVKKPVRPRKPRLPKDAVTQEQKRTVMDTFKAVKNSSDRKALPTSKKSNNAKGKKDTQDVNLKTHASINVSTPIRKNSPDRTVNHTTPPQQQQQQQQPSSSPLSSLSSPPRPDDYELPPLRPQPPPLIISTHSSPEMQPHRKTEGDGSPIHSDSSFKYRSIKVKGDGNTIFVEADGPSIFVEGCEPTMPGVASAQRDSKQRPSTPERMHQRRRSETISPRSVPRGMVDLFD